MSEQNDDKLCQEKPLRSVYKFSSFHILSVVSSTIIIHVYVFSYDFTSLFLSNG